MRLEFAAFKFVFALGLLAVFIPACHAQEAPLTCGNASDYFINAVKQIGDRTITPQTGVARMKRAWEVADSDGKRHDCILSAVLIQASLPADTLEQAGIQAEPVFSLARLSLLKLETARSASVRGDSTGNSSAASLLESYGGVERQLYKNVLRVSSTPTILIVHNNDPLLPVRNIYANVVVYDREGNVLCEGNAMFDTDLAPHATVRQLLSINGTKSFGSNCEVDAAEAKTVIPTLSFEAAGRQIELKNVQ